MIAGISRRLALLFGIVVVTSSWFAHGACLGDAASAQRASRTRGRRPAQRAPTAPVVEQPAGPCPAEMVLIPGGTFEMGSATAESLDARVPHAVTLDPYCIGRTEVTVGSYRACIASRACGLNAPLDLADRLGTAPAADLPMTNVTWGEAVRFCEWRGGDLPTEAQWEYAARGSDGRRYPWGNDPPDSDTTRWSGGQCEGQCPRVEGPVATHPRDASPFGVLDMAGNVAEWARDWYGPYVGSPVSNPTGPASGTARVSRSATSYVTHEWALTTYYRFRAAPDAASAARGFRCARTPLHASPQPTQ